MDWDIRPLHEADLAAVIALDARAFGFAEQESRNLDFLKIVAARHSSTCFTAVRSGSVCGFLLAQRHGSLAFISMLAVDPLCQRQGIGTSLLLHAIDALSANCDVAGVQTPVESTYIVSMMVKRGFQLVEPQLILRLPIAGRLAKETPTATRGRWQDLFGVLDWGRALEAASFGKLLVVSESDVPVATGVLELVPRRNNIGRTAAILSFGGACRTLGGAPLSGLLDTAAHVAANASRTHLYFALNAFYQREVESLLKSGAQIVRTSYRLVLSRTLPKYRQLLSLPQIDVSQWSL